MLREVMCMFAAGHRLRPALILLRVSWLSTMHVCTDLSMGVSSQCKMSPIRLNCRCSLRCSCANLAQPFTHKHAPAGGISSVSFSATGEHCLTAGLDGAVLLHTVQDTGKAQVSQLTVPSPALGDVQDVDAMDDDSEATEVR